MADGLSAAAGLPVRLPSGEVTIGANVGVAVYPVDGEEFATLLHSADVDMQGRKAAARGRTAAARR